jgi:hypothetical protein
MRVFRKHLIAVGAVGLAVVAMTGGAVGALTRHGPASPDADPARRVSPVCPGYNRHVIGSTTIGSTAALVPAGAQQVLLCRYSGVGLNRGKAVRLIALRLVHKRATVDRLAAEFNTLRPLGGAYNCPSDSGAAIIAFFRYGSASKSDDPVTVGLSGCVTVTNGHLTRTAIWPPGPTLLRRLEALTSSPGTRSEPYRLSTHCGIEWAKILGAFWKAARPLSDGHGNPPSGWGNPLQQGTLTFSGRGTAVFRSVAGSVTFHRTTRPQPRSSAHNSGGPRSRFNPEIIGGGL